MEPTRNRKWPTILFFSAVGLALAAAIYPIARSARTPSSWKAPLAQVSPAAGNVVSIEGDRVLLVSGKEAVFKSSKIVYRGIEDGQVCFDLFILQLDPHYSYVHKIPVREARRGFRLGDQDFELLTARNSKVKLKLVN
jgi:hypothetical protein